jgi:hypothetical protein
MKVEVENVGDPAFFTRINLIIPKVTPIVEIPSICYDLSNQDRKETYALVCELGYPLERNVIILFITFVCDKRISKQYFKISIRSRGGSRIDTVELQHPLLPLDIIDNI